MNKEYIFELHTNFNNNLINDWKNALEKSECHYFQDINFIIKYLTYNQLSKSNEINIILVKSTLNNELLYIFPFEVFNFVGFKILRWLGTRDFDYCGPIKINSNNNINFFELWKNLLKFIKGYDLVLLLKQPEKINNYINPFVKYLPTKLYSKYFLVNLNFDFEKYLESIENKKFINEFLRLKNKLTTNHSVEIKVENNDNYTFLPNKIIKEKIKYLKNNRIKTNLNNSLCSFYDDLFLNNKNIFIASIFIDKKLVSACINFVYKNKFYYYMPIIFNKEFNKYSPGKLLIHHLIFWSFQNKLQFFDFGLGEENYKKYWSNEILGLFRYMEYKTIKGLILFWIFKVFFFLKNFRKL